MTRTARKARKRFVEASSWSDISNDVVDHPPSNKKERGTELLALSDIYCWIF